MISQRSHNELEHGQEFIQLSEYSSVSELPKPYVQSSSQYNWPLRKSGCNAETRAQLYRTEETIAHIRASEVGGSLMLEPWFRRDSSIWCNISKQTW